MYIFNLALLFYLPLQHVHVCIYVLLPYIVLY